MNRERIEESIYRRDGHLEVIVFATTPKGRRQLYERVQGGIREARNVRKKLRVQAASGSVAADASVRFREHTEQWLEHRRRIGKIRPRTEQRYRELLQRFAWPVIGNRKLANVDADTLQAVVDDMAARSLDPSQTFAVLRAALRYGVKKRRISYNPAEGVELPTRRRPELTVPSQAELERILGAAGEPTEPFRVALTIAAACGLRRSEVLGLRWNDLDLDGGVLYVRRGLHAVRRPRGGTELVEHPPKSDRGSRSVEIPTSVAAILKRYRAAQGARRLTLAEAWGEGWHADDVVIDDGLGRPIRPDTLSQRWRKLRTRVGVRPEIRLHDFRALYVTESLAAGVDAGVVAQQVGHARPDFTRDVYQRARRSDARPAADAIDRALGVAFATPSVDKALTREDEGVVAMRREGH